ncbi:MAG: tRNA dihydrouridine(20/20a) synthase DusA [Reinekea sp.]
MSKPFQHIFSVAPMMDWTTSECRQFHRLLSNHALLYTEMVTTGAIIHGQKERFLNYHNSEHPLALQLGGHDPADLSHCAKLAGDFGYDEVNLNVGCPSDRVQNGMIGAVLMGHANLVTECFKAMADQTDIPVTVKHRIGIDDLDSYEFLRDFVGSVAKEGCQTFIVHARKAILSGLSPKENREIPPLDYDRVIRLKQDFPDLNIVINGGIKTHEQAIQLLDQGLDGVMLGREAYQNPLILTDVDSLYYGEEPPVQNETHLKQVLSDWVRTSMHDGIPLKYLARHMLGLFPGRRGAKQYRRYLSENMHSGEVSTDTFEQALGYIG